jgi:F0F1-type ATP synthase delta subunit
MIGSKEIAYTMIASERDARVSSKTLARNLVHYLQKNKRIDLLPEIIRIMSESSVKDEVYRTVSITTPYVTEKEDVQKIISFISPEATNITEVHVDKNLIGGFIAEHRGVIYDASIQKQIQLLKNKLIQR